MRRSAVLEVVMGNLSSAAATAAVRVVTNHVRVSAMTLWYFVYLKSGRCGPLGVLTGLDEKYCCFCVKPHTQVLNNYVRVAMRYLISTNSAAYGNKHGSTAVM